MCWMDERSSGCEVMKPISFRAFGWTHILQGFFESKCQVVVKDKKYETKIKTSAIS